MIICQGLCDGIKDGQHLNLIKSIPISDGKPAFMKPLSAVDNRIERYLITLLLIRQNGRMTHSISIKINHQKKSYEPNR